MYVCAHEDVYIYIYIYMCIIMFVLGRFYGSSTHERNYDSCPRSGSNFEQPSVSMLTKSLCWFAFVALGVAV